MKLIELLMHKCTSLERSSKESTGMIMKCKECGRRFKIEWADYERMNKDVLLH